MAIDPAVLILVTCMSTLVLSRASPFNNSLINGGHVCTDLLLLTILLSSVLHNSIRDSTATNADMPLATFVFIFFCLVWPGVHTGDMRCCGIAAS